MNNLLFIIINIILPIFLQMGLGFGLKKLINFDVNSLAKIQLYILIPALLFVKMYSSDLNKEVLIGVFLHSFLLFGLLYLISYGFSKLNKFSKSQTCSFTNSICFYNSGNYCLPLIQLLYNNPFALSIQLLIMTVQNILTNTFGIFTSSSGSKQIKHALLDVLKVPMLYCVILAFILRGAGIQVWTPVWNALDSLGNGLIPLAILTLGAQLADTKISFKIPRVYVSVFLRLIISPAIAFLLIILLGLKGITAEVLMISSAAPTAVNSVLLAIQYDNEPEFASQAIFLSTLVSAFTVSGVIYLLK